VSEKLPSTHVNAEHHELEHGEVVIYWTATDNHWMDFCVVLVNEWNHADRPTVLDNVAEADAGDHLARGFIKWDGCCEFVSQQGDGQALHFCGRRMALTVGDAITLVYDTAAKQLGAWDASCAK
jgi:hypothetical protein